MHKHKHTHRTNRVEVIEEKLSIDGIIGRFDVFYLK